MALPDDYIAALEQLAVAFETYKNQTGSEAVLVGGAATAILTQGLFPSGDFDVVAGRDQEFDQAMTTHGFRRENQPGYRIKGWYHPDHLDYGFEQVSGYLFDGRADRKRLIRLAVEPRGEIVIPSVEDMIADRLAAHSQASPTDDSRLRQARALFKLAETIDRDYLLERISDEGGDASLLDVTERIRCGS